MNLNTIHSPTFDLPSKSIKVGNGNLAYDNFQKIIFREDDTYRKDINKYIELVEVAIKRDKMHVEKIRNKKMVFYSVLGSIFLPVIITVATFVLKWPIFSVKYYAATILSGYVGGKTGELVGSVLAAREHPHLKEAAEKIIKSEKDRLTHIDNKVHELVSELLLRQLEEKSPAITKSSEELKSLSKAIGSLREKIPNKNRLCNLIRSESSTPIFARKSIFSGLIPSRI